MPGVPGVPGVPWHTQILADQLSLFQSGGTDYADLITTGTPGFSDLPTALESVDCRRYVPWPSLDQGPLNRWTSQLDWRNSSGLGGLETVVSEHNSIHKFGAPSIFNASCEKRYLNYFNF